MLKQINSKIGGDLYHMKFPQKMDNMKSMLIGIDVCHAGGKSIVGFAASTNAQMSQYYSDFFAQNKGQEIVSNEMVECIKKAMEKFSKCNGNQLPTDIIIFRDGVSAAERSQVIDREISQF